MDYTTFVASKNAPKKQYGFVPAWVPEFLFDFQRDLLEWSVRKGRAAIFADCGLGKTPLQLVWAENVIRKTGKNVLVLTPLAVAEQTVREGNKFGITVRRSKDGKVHNGITVTNYHRLHYYNPKDFVAVVLDESSIVKNFDGKYRKTITEFLHQVEYRLLCTATPAPNDFMELGTSAEALGAMSRNSMLGMFFTNDMESTQQWRIKGHAKKRFWQWVASWAKAVRRPSDLGYPDEKFKLPSLNMHRVSIPSKARGTLFPELARTLAEQRKERKNSLTVRCQKVASLVPKNRPAVVWCHLNSEGDLLEKLIPGAVQVSGSQTDEEKEKRLNGFSTGNVKTLITKPSLTAFGLNWQHCSDVFYFPSHSHEQFYQAIRRCWRFGQEKEVNCHLVFTEIESLVVGNMLRKERQSDEMYEGILRHMKSAEEADHQHTNGAVTMEVPSWL